MYFKLGKSFQPEKTILFLLFLLVPIVTSFNVHQPYLIKAQLLKALISVWIIIYFVNCFRAKKISFPQNYLTWTVITLLGLYDVSFIFTQYKLIGFERLELFIFFVIFFFLVTQIIQEQRFLTTAMVVLAFSATIISIYGIFQYVTGEIDRVISTLGHPNFLAGYLVGTLPLTIGLFMYLKENLKKNICGLSIFTQVVCLVFTFSRSAMLSLFMAFIFFIILYLRQKMNQRSLHFKKRRWAVFLVAVVCVFFSVAVSLRYIVPDSEWSRVTTLTERSNQNTLWMRWLEWKGTLGIIKQNPVFGNGPGTFSIFFPAAQPIEFSKLSVERNEFLRHAHNEYLEFWSEIGILGLLLFLSIIGLAIFSGKMLLKCNQDHRSFFLILGMIAGLISICFHMLFSVGFRFIVIPFVFWFYLGAINGLTLSKFGKIKDVQLTKSKLFLITPIFLIICSFLVISNIKGISYVRAEMSFYDGIVDSKAGNYGKSVDNLKNAIRLNKTKPEIYYLKGATEVRLNRWSEALETYTLLEKIHPNFFHTNYNLSLCYFKLGDFNKSISFGRKELKTYPSFIDQHVLLGQVFFGEKNFNESEKYFNAVLKKRPGDSRSRVYLAKIHVSRGDWDEALNQYKIILEDQPYHLTARLNISKLYVKTGEFDKACSNIEFIIDNRSKFSFPESKEEHIRLILKNMLAQLDREAIPQKCLDNLNSISKYP